MKTGCSGFCIGNAATALTCTYPDSTSELHAPECVDVDGAPSTITHFPCDQNGGFTEVPGDCGGFRCDGPSACKTSCAADTDCISDFVCLAGSGAEKSCQALTGPLCDGKFTLRRPTADGGNMVCPDHYTCPEGSTQCRTDCDSADDCVDDSGIDFVCNSEHKCVPQLMPPGLASCGCRLADRERAGLSWLLWLGAAAISVLRRRPKAFSATGTTR
jgi:hypothetical protein